MGARCEENTFDGERCLYGALNNEIRSLLRNFKVVTSQSIRRDLYEEFLRRLLEESLFCDVEFVVHGQPFPAHRCILCARCELLRQLFEGKWRHRRSIRICHKLMTITAFHSFLQYLYTGAVRVPVSEVNELLLVLRHCRLWDAERRLHDMKVSADNFSANKPGTSIAFVSLESEPGQLASHLRILAELASPNSESWVDGSELPFLSRRDQLFPDMRLCVGGTELLCHSAFVCSRSDYFRTLVANDPFGEVTFQDGLRVVSLECISPEAVTAMLHYVYTDSAQLSAEVVDEVLLLADMALMPGLKRRCGHYLCSQVTTTSVLPLVRTARLYQLSKLEERCAEFIAQHLDEMLVYAEFAHIILEDAHSVHKREDTDSIPIVDDVRYHIAKSVQSFEQEQHAAEQLTKLGALLETLGLHA